MQNALHYAVLNKNKEMISFLCDLDSDNPRLRTEENIRGLNPLQLDKPNDFF